MRPAAPVARLLLVALAPAWLAACEPRIEEPRPRASTGAPVTTSGSGTASGPGSTGATEPGRATPAAGGACVRPTPDQPTRTVEGPVPAPGCPEDPGPVPTLARGKVKFVDAPQAPTVSVEIAERDEDRQRGLMYRTQMPADEGMIFLFERARKLSFWMRNTCIPLDMLFVAEDGTIVNVEENVPTLTDRTFTSGGCPAMFVVELNAGWARAHGVKAGQKIAFER